MYDSLGTSYFTQMPAGCRYFSHENKQLKSGRSLFFCFENIRDFVASV